MLGRRWPDVMVKDLAQEEPVWAMKADDAAELGSRRRGVEPLRIVVMPQKVQRVTSRASARDRADAGGRLSRRSPKRGNDMSLHWRFDSTRSKMLGQSSGCRIGRRLLLVPVPRFRGRWTPYGTRATLPRKGNIIAAFKGRKSWQKSRSSLAAMD